MQSLIQFVQLLKRSIRRVREVDKMNHAAELNGQSF